VRQQPTKWVLDQLCSAEESEVVSAHPSSSQDSVNSDQLPAPSISAAANSESTQHSSATRRLKRLTKASGDSLISKKVAQRTASNSRSRIQVRQPQDLIGLLLAGDRYRVKSQLGKGSMAYVFLAEDHRLKTDVVIKVPKPELFTTQDFRERFKRESQLLVRFSHPHVVGVLDVGEYDGLPYVVMPLLSGGSLLDRLKKDGNEKKQMTPESLRDWVPGVARALDFCFRKGLVHRDVKPANILFDDDNNAFVGDFGLSKVMYGEHTELNSSETMAGIVLGTPNYVSPEVIHGKPYDGRADQYSLGITVYQMLFGRAPMQGASPTVTMINQTQRKLKLLSEIRPDVSRRLALAIQKSIEKQPQDRFACCEDFAEAVLEGLRDKPIKTIQGTSANIASGINPAPPIRNSNAACTAAEAVVTVNSSGEQLDWLNTALEQTTTTSLAVHKAKKKRTGPVAKPLTDALLPIAPSTGLLRLAETLKSWRQRFTHGTAMGIAAGILAAVSFFTVVVWLFGSTTDAPSRVSGKSSAGDTAAVTDDPSPVSIDGTAPTVSPFSDTDAMLKQMKNDKQRKVWEWKAAAPSLTDKPQK
jgi:serine/threonine protein kinase